jgi:hypothetical protein
MQASPQLFRTYTITFVVVIRDCSYKEANKIFFRFYTLLILEAMIDDW